MAENMPESAILTVTEVARYLKLSKVMVYRMIEDGRIPHYRFGRAVRIPRDRFFVWLKSQEREEQETQKVVANN
ncbi:MAG TPA: helix-turn-helix domain-containing protein [Spirochaetia bacterium]|nr:helix-turn-helix domain-containing protein [Spirochaetia bacterium]